MNIYQLIDKAKLVRINDGDSYIYRIEVPLKEEVRVFKGDIGTYRGKCKKKKNKQLREDLKRRLMENTFARAWSFTDRLL